MSEVYIRSQDREGLFVVSSATVIAIGKEEVVCTKEESNCIFLHTEKAMYKLAKYESRERCVEVLNEIQDVCGRYLYAAGNYGLMWGTGATPPMAANIPRVYLMPET